VPVVIRPMQRITSRPPALLLGLVAALFVSSSAVAEPSAESKRREAQSVLEDIRQIDTQVALAAEAYNAANIELGQIRREQRANERLLKLARGNLTQAHRTLERRVVDLYTTDASGTALEVILGATSLDDLLNRLETVDRVSEQDQRVLEQVVSFRTAVQQRKVRLAQARAKQERVVAQRAAHRQAVEARLRERQRLLASIRDEIARIQAAERRRALAAARATRAQISTNPQAYSLGGPVVEPAADGASAAPPSRYGGVVGIAMQYLGTPYRWGGASPSGFDCSGFVMYVYAQVGVSLPHNAAAQYSVGVPVSRSELQPGDLVFFNGLGHNGMYVGGGNFIHSPHTGDVVKISSLSQDWYTRTWVGARRIT
jgi:cell wall-associated NlpC family hydrolase